MGARATGRDSAHTPACLRQPNSQKATDEQTQKIDCTYFFIFFRRPLFDLIFLWNVLSFISILPDPSQWSRWGCQLIKHLWLNSLWGKEAMVFVTLRHPGVLGRALSPESRSEQNWEMWCSPRRGPNMAGRKWAHWEQSRNKGCSMLYENVGAEETPINVSNMFYGW